MSCQTVLTKSVNPKLPRGKIFPLFIPFAGCPHTCIFCAQESQTGRGKMNAATAVAQAKNDFPLFLERCGSDLMDMAFYGGTFTAVNEDDFRLCLDFFKDCRKLAEQCGKTLLGRCSTRPDSLYPDRLEKLKNAGFDLIELGIQSFDGSVLSKSARGYDAETAETACRTVQDSGFLLGMQLMAGLPLQTEEIFLEDARKALLQNPACLRYYPCLVPEGTGLATLMRRGEYAPWSNEMCIKTIGTALALAWERGIPVIRLCVAPEQEFDKNLAAGPRSPGLGSDIMAYALFLTIKQSIAAMPSVQKIVLDASWQGCLFGTKNFLKEKYAALIPLRNIVLAKANPFEIRIF